MSTPACVSAWLVTFTLGAGGLFAAGEDLSGVPAKIEVTTTSPSALSAGGVKIELLDPANRPAPAKKDLQVEVDTKTENGSVGKSTVTIKEGQTGVTAPLPTNGTGIVEVTASHPELAQGGTVVNVPPDTSQQATPPPSPAPIATVAPNLTPAPDQVSGGAAPTRTEQARHAEEHAAAEHQHGQMEREMQMLHDYNGSTQTGSGSGGGHTGSTRAPASAGSVGSFQRSLAARSLASDVSSRFVPNVNHAAAAPPVLKLRYYPTRKLRADENDPATVWASLPGDEPASTDFSVYLMSDLGPLTPEPIKIPKGSVIGQAKLVATRPGAVQVWYQYSTPPATSPDPPLTINFTHPVWAPKLVPSQPTVTLFDSIDVGVELVKYDGTSVPADEARSVYISIGAGAGDVSPTEVKFNANAGRALTKFTPTRPGRIRLVATSTYLPEQTVEFNVTTPWLLLGLCAFGGFLGGLLAYWTEKPTASFQRIWIGLITGFVLYWALLFGVVLVPHFPHVYLVNPFSAIVLPLLGGWGGTKVITMILKPLGFSW
jgi:hypothetical protein